MMRWLTVAFLFLAACSGETPGAPQYHAEENPESLSDWGMLGVNEGKLVLSDGITPYDLATPLFSDYALKLRTVWTPEGAPAQYDPNEAFDFPIGSVVTKTFYYNQETADWNGAVTTDATPPLIDNTMALTGVRLMETRVLVRRTEGWVALPYVWNEDQTDAVLKRTGAIIPLTLVKSEEDIQDFAYIVPNANQCAGCHATNASTKAILPIGLKARHLNKQSTFQPAFNQLDHWLAKGLLDENVEDPAPQNAIWTDASATLDSRARAYLDINCSHCHNPNGPADTSGLDLEPDADGHALGKCKLPIAAGGGTGGRPFDIVPGAPERSITIYRMETTDPGAMMPELGRAVAHDQGVALIAEWISAMDGEC